MRCTVPGLNVKILGRVAQAMAKIGDELYLESSVDSLALRTINSSESAYCSVAFGRSFFSHYDGDLPIKCKISAKSALAALKPQNRTDAKIEACDIRADDAGHLIVRLRFKHGILKTHYLSILESKNMEVAYDKDQLPNRFVANCKIFSDAIDNFQPSDDQITFEAKLGTLVFRNFAGNDLDMPRTTRTQLSLKCAEFESFSIGEEGTATFATKEFKALLSLAEALDLSIASYFGSSGSPIVFIVSHDNSAFEANFVLATDKPDLGTQSAESTQCSEKTGKRNVGHLEDTPLYKKRAKFKTVNDRFELRDDSYLFDSINIIGNENDESFMNNETVKTVSDIAQQNADVINSNAQPINKIKSVFRRCFDETIVDSKINQVISVIAGDSDSE